MWPTCAEPSWPIGFAGPTRCGAFGAWRRSPRRSAKGHRFVMTSNHYQVFRELHASGCFVIPNPWDLGSARVLVQLGFRALATTSSGFAWSCGRPDNGVPLEEALAHFRRIAEGVDVPVNGDFEGGFA